MLPETARYSRYAIWTVAVVMTAIFLFGQRWSRGKVISEDVVIYYSFLPATFIYGDITMEFAGHDAFFKDKIWGFYSEKGRTQKYTMGLAMLYSPFFLLGHLSAVVTGAPPDGFSAPYTFWLQFSAVFYLILGLIFLRKILLRWFDDRIAALVLLTLAFGTNLFYYTAAQAPMPHAYLFALFSLFLWLCLRFFEAPNWWRSIALAAVGSLICLVRPSHILIWILPVLIGVYDRESLQARLRFVRTHYLKLLIWPLIALLVALPQLLYWKHMTGHWLHYSYREEGFFFAQPAIWNGLFSFRNGWLLYTPVMAFAIGGLFLLRRYTSQFRYAFPVFLLLAGYLILSWWCWWYGGSFGSRVWIDLYPLLALGLAALLQFLLLENGKQWLRKGLIGLLLLFSLLNVFQSWQFTRGILHYDSMTARAWVAVFGRTEKPEGLESLLEKPDYEAARVGR